MGPDGSVNLTIVARVVDGEMNYRGYERGGVRKGFAYPLAGVTGRVDVRSPADEAGATEILLTGLQGFHGGVKVTAHGTIREWKRSRAKADIVIEAFEVPLDENIRRASAGMEGIWRTWSPRGIAKRVQVLVEQVPDLDRSAEELVTIELDGRAGFTYARLPLPLEKVSGTVLYRKERVGERRVPVTVLQGLRGEAAGGTLSADGTAEEMTPEDATLRVAVEARGVRLEGALEEAIRAAPIPAAVSVWDRVRPRGRADLGVKITGTESRQREEIRVDLRGGAIEGWGDLRFPLEGLSGTVEVKPERIDVRGVRGTSSSGEETVVEGSILDPAGAVDLDLRVSAPGTLLDETLAARLGRIGEKVKGFFEVVRPAPGIRGDVTVGLRGPVDTLDPVIDVERVAGGAGPFGIANLDLGGGRARYEQGVVTLEGLTGSIADREFLLREGRLDLDRGEGALAFEVRRLRFPRDLVPLIPEGTAAGIEDVAPGRFFHVDDLRVALAEKWRRLTLDGLVSLSPQREGATGGLGIEGTFHLQGVTFLRGESDADPIALSGLVEVSRGVIRPGVPVEELHGTFTLGGSVGSGSTGVTARMADASARVLGRELRDATADLSIHEGAFLLKDLAGTFAKGALHASIEAGGGKRAYEGSVSLANAAARGLFKPADPESPIRGQVDATLKFWNKSGAIADLRGENCTVTIRNGKILEVPIFKGLYGVLGIEAPEFTSGEAQFDLVGDRIDFDNIDLSSTVLGIHKAAGRSRAWLDGRLDINLRPEFKTLTNLPWPFNWFVEAANVPIRPIYERINAIHVGGSIDQPIVDNRILRGLFSSDGKDRPFLLPPEPVLDVQGRPAWDF